MKNIYTGDCLKILKKIPDDSVDLIFTSPPYADRRKNSYSSINSEDYVEWFIERANEMKRVLKPKGTFILNIKEKAENGERLTYVIELILEMKKNGWLWTEEFIWHKKNSMPGYWPNRFRDAWERLIQFNKQKEFNMYQQNVQVPIGDWAEKRFETVKDYDEKRFEMNTGSGFSRKVSNWKDKDFVNPDNVLHLGVVGYNKNHSAAFPKHLPEWFIKLFTKENDVVLDPFAGSGTTLVTAKELNRQWIGVEIEKKYIDLIENNLYKTVTQKRLFD